MHPRQGTHDSSDVLHSAVDMLQLYPPSFNNDMQITLDFIQPFQEQYSILCSKEKMYSWREPFQVNFISRYLNGACFFPVDPRIIFYFLNRKGGKGFLPINRLIIRLLIH